MGLEQYEEYKTSQFNQRKIAKLIQDVKAGLSEMLKSEDPIEYIHNNRRKYVYDDIKKRIYAELIEKAIIPHMCQYAIKNGSPIEYAKDMVFMAEQLDEGKQRNILKDMAQLILQF